MFDIDYIIPCYGTSEIIRPGLRALANQWHSEYIHVVLVNDCSPNTDCDYQDLVDEFLGNEPKQESPLPSDLADDLLAEMGFDSKQ